MPAAGKVAPNLSGGGIVDQTLTGSGRPARIGAMNPTHSTPVRAYGWPVFLEDPDTA